MSDKDFLPEKEARKHLSRNQLIAIVAAGATLVIAIFTALAYFTNASIPYRGNEKPIITAKARFRLLDLPYSYESALRGLGHPKVIARDKKIQSLMEQIPVESHEEIIGFISKYIYENMPYYLGGSHSDIFPDFLVGYWDINLENASDITAEDVVLEIPGRIVLTEIFRKGAGKIEVEKDRDFLRLGSLRPQEKVNINAWSVRYEMEQSYDKFVLTHEFGVGEVITN